MQLKNIDAIRYILVYEWFKGKKGVGASIFCRSSGVRRCYKVGHHTTIFPAKIYASERWAREILSKSYSHNSIKIFSGS